MIVTRSMSQVAASCVVLWCGMGCAAGHTVDAGVRTGFDGGEASDLGATDLGAVDGGGGDLGTTDLGSGDLGRDLGPVDLGTADLGRDLGPPDLGPPDLGRDLGPIDAGCVAGAIRSCSTACGTTGVATCASGSFGACAAPAETCNDLDDDCDGTIDDGVRVLVFDPVPMSQLTALQPACTGPGSGLDTCLSTVHRWCGVHALGCFASGAGFLQATATGARVACLAHAGTTVVNATFADVSTVSSVPITLANIGDRVAQSGAHRWCGALGYATGVGPVEHSATDMAIACLDAAIAATVSIPLGEVIGRGCDALGNPNSLECAAAVDLGCRDRGYAAGFGPVEWNTSIVVAACLRP